MYRVSLRYEPQSLQTEEINIFVMRSSKMSRDVNFLCVRVFLFWHFLLGYH